MFIELPTAKCQTNRSSWAMPVLWPASDIATQCGHDYPWLSMTIHDYPWLTGSRRRSVVSWAPDHLVDIFIGQRCQGAQSFDALSGNRLVVQHVLHPKLRHGAVQYQCNIWQHPQRYQRILKKNHAHLIFYEFPAFHSMILMIHLDIPMKFPFLRCFVTWEAHTLDRLQRSKVAGGPGGGAAAFSTWSTKGWRLKCWTHFEM